MTTRVEPVDSVAGMFSQVVSHILLTVVSAAIVGGGMHDPASVLVAVGVLVAWWLLFIATAVAKARLRDAPGQ
jgi:hypothetical protein